MTYQELRDELYRVKDNRFAIRSKYNDLTSIRQQELERIGNGAIDYAKDRIQTTKDPDKALINVLEYVQRQENALEEAIKALEEANRYYEELIYSMRGLHGEILRLFFIDGLSMRKVAKRVGYEEKYTYRHWNSAIYELLEVINENDKKHV